MIDVREFMDENFLLDDEVAAELYHQVAAPLPIIDYHCHLPVAQLAADHRFGSITELWLDGDHYKWRAMRANGIGEQYISGKASDWERFLAWATTVPATLRNPLYHWTHMELRRPFGLRELLSAESARRVYEHCNELLADGRYSALGLLREFRVAAVCTTDDPADSLEHHEALAGRRDPDTCVSPTWRPDRALQVDEPTAWNAWVSRLEAASGVSVTTYQSFLDALESRHRAFHDRGCRASDHGLLSIPAQPFTPGAAEAAFDRLRAGHVLDAGGSISLRSALLHALAVLDHARGWVQQFHLGALRDTNSRLRRLLGGDCGADSIGDVEQAAPLARFLDGLDRSDRLAKTILYNVNPRDNELFATMTGNFQDGSAPGKMQYGAAWWFLDQLDGMRRQLDALSAMGLLSRFVGMVTDSRSFLSYSRHEYFRRLLCGMLGADVRRGYLPDDRALLAHLVRSVCFVNARDYFGLRLGRLAAGYLSDTLPRDLPEGNLP